MTQTDLREVKEIAAKHGWTAQEGGGYPDGDDRAGASGSSQVAGSATRTLIADHQAGGAGSGVFAEIENRATAGDRAAQHYLGWNLPA